MKPLRDQPIRRKLTILTLVSAVIALSLAGVLFILTEYHTEREQHLHDTQILARVLADRSTAALEFADQQLAQSNLGVLELDDKIELACIHRIGQDEVFAMYVADGVGDATCPAANAFNGATYLDGDLHVALPIENVGVLRGSIYLRSSQAPVYERTLLTVAYMLVFGAAGVLLAYASLRYLLPMIVTPLQQLTSAARRIRSSADYTVRADKAGEDEIGMLADAFNAMLDKIQVQNEELLDAKSDLEAQVKARTRELTNANTELEAFAYSVSHDLRAPLRSIHGFCQVLLEDYADALDAQGQAHLVRVQAAANRMRDLIQDLLALSSATRQKMSTKSVDLSRLATESCDALRQVEPQRNVAVAIQQGMTVVGDEALLKVLVDNLLGNAWKYTGRTENAEIAFGGQETERGHAYFIRDNGVGFDMEYANKLFTPFQRLHGADEFEGTGVGLATVQRIVRRHGGEVWAEAEPGKGATFWFRLDASLQPRQAQIGVD